MKRIPLMGFLMLAALPLAAQEPAHPQHDRQASGGNVDHMAAMHEMMAPMMGLMAFTPEHLLARKDALALTAQQITRLTALRAAVKTTHDAAETDAKTHRDALMRTWAVATPDTAAVRQHFQAVHAAMGSGHSAMLRAAAQAKGVLTDHQRGRVEGWADAMAMHRTMEMHERMEIHERKRMHEGMKQP